MALAEQAYRWYLYRSWSYLFVSEWVVVKWVGPLPGFPGPMSMCFAYGGLSALRMFALLLSILC